MNKLEVFLDKIYNNGANTSLYFYVILGGLALVLILIMILASMKPVTEEVKSNQGETPGELPGDKKNKKTKKEKKIKVPKINAKTKKQPKTEMIKTEEVKVADTIIMEPVISSPVFEEPKDLEVPEIVVKEASSEMIASNEIEEEILENKLEQTNFSSVYLDVKPVLEPVYNPEEELELNDKELNISPESSSKELFDIPSEDLSINPEVFSLMDDPKEIPEKSEQVEPDFSQEIILPAEKTDIAFNDNFSSIITEGELNSPVINEKVIIKDISEELEIPKIQNISDEIINPVNISDLKEEELKMPQLQPEKQDTFGKVVLSTDDLKAKLEQLSISKATEQKTEQPDESLDNLLRQMGVEKQSDMPKLQNEESIMLGK